MMLKTRALHVWDTVRSRGIVQDFHDILLMLTHLPRATGMLRGMEDTRLRKDASIR